MSKLAWYVVIMIAIDVVLYIARFGVAIIKSAKDDDGRSEGNTPHETEPASGSTDGAANTPSA